MASHIQRMRYEKVIAARCERTYTNSHTTKNKIRGKNGVNSHTHTSIACTVNDMISKHFIHTRLMYNLARVHQAVKRRKVYNVSWMREASSFQYNRCANMNPVHHTES